MQRQCCFSIDDYSWENGLLPHTSAAAWRSSSCSWHPRAIPWQLRHKVLKLISLHEEKKIPACKKRQLLHLWSTIHWTNASLLFLSPIVSRSLPIPPLFHFCCAFSIHPSVSLCFSFPLSLSPLAFLFSIYVIPLSSVSPIPYLSLLSFFAPLITLLLYLSICHFCYFTLPFSICNNLALVLFLFLSLSLMLMCCICLSIPLHRYF